MSQSARLKIRQLRALLDDGLLSAQEFEQRKNAILDAQLAPSTPQFRANEPQISTSLTELGLMAGQELGPVNKRYRLERLLGQGGMGQVWRAMDLATHAQLGASEHVALKILPPQLTQSALHTKLLVEEATQARKLAHEHIVRVYEWAQDPATTSYFIIMELLEGRDLQQHLHEHGPLSLEHIHTLLLPVAQGLRYAWDKHQLVHRDLKPSNLFLTRQGEIKLLDFGIAASVHGSAHGVQLPANAGTAGYRAPESGLSERQAAPQLDVYSVAVMIYQLLTGQLPFGPRHVLGQAVSAPQGVNPAQWRVLQRGFSHTVQERPNSVLDLLTAMQQAGAALHLAKPALAHPQVSMLEQQVREHTAREQARQQADLEAKILQERKREQQEKQQRLQETRERATQQLKRIAQEQQKQLQEAKAREQLRKQQEQQELQEQQRIIQKALEKVAALRTPLATLAPVNLADLFVTDAPEMFPPHALPVSPAMPEVTATDDQPDLVGKSFHDMFLDGNGVGPELMVLPAGRFLMGSPESERNAAIRAGAQRAWVERETPQHWVQFERSFAIGQFPVTVEQWSVFAQETGWQDDSVPACPPPDFAQDARHPAVCLSWQDAQLYLAWLSQKTGERYRLPSEAEWEYACRAGTRSAFHFGDLISTELANYDGNFTFNGSSKGQFRRGTSPVGSYPANAWGLYDMHGNVWEWVLDKVHDSYHGAPEDGSEWAEGGDAGRRILRGGCWLYNPRYLRSAMRNAFWYGGKNDIVGFRVVREMNP